MPYRVLVPIDGSEPAREAISHALERYGNDEITALYVLDPGELAPYAGVEGGVMIDFEALQRERRAEAETLLESTKTEAADAGVQIETDVRTGRVGQTIVKYADEHEIDHIVIGSHGRSGVDRLLLGSVAETVARRSSVPVTIVR